MNLADFRKSYTSSTLDAAFMSKDPIEQFNQWLKQAIEAQLVEPNAMVLSTLDEGNKPSSRVVLLKHISEVGFVFFTNYLSKKASNISQNPNVSLNFWWADLERQVRIEGIVEKISELDSLTYFNSRPKESQLGAWTSQQSQKINSRQELENNYKILEDKYSEKSIPKPENWGGYVVIPFYFEFWQGRVGRLHDRICYQKKDLNWDIFRLSP